MERGNLSIGVVFGRLNRSLQEQGVSLAFALKLKYDTYGNGGFSLLGKVKVHVVCEY
jgi:hypothetical protein